MRTATIVLIVVALVAVIGAAAALALPSAMVTLDPIEEPVTLDADTHTVPVMGGVALDDDAGVCALTSFDVRVDDASLLGGAVADPATSFGWGCEPTADWQVDWTVADTGTYEVVAETVAASEVGSARQLVRQEVTVERP